MTTVNKDEVDKFTDLDWWDPNGPMKPLHELNPARLEFIQQSIELDNLKVLDVGCGAGILAESMAANGANVTAIDANPAVIEQAKDHADLMGFDINYQNTRIETFCQQSTEKYPVITCMELLEHVDDPAGFIQYLVSLLADDGLLFLSTLNRNLKAYAIGIVGAEYLLQALPKGTHDYQKFIKPAELAKFCRAVGCRIQQFKGMHYNPLTGTAKLSDDVSINYLAKAYKNGGNNSII